jgi:hypothetical protein
MSSLGPPELRRIRGCHARLSLGTPRAFRDAARTSCGAVSTRTSGGGGACLPTLKVPPPRGVGDAAACPHKGPTVARPLDRETTATARRGQGAAATTATGRGSTAARALEQPSLSLMNRDGA